MKITVLCVGRLKNAGYAEALAEYARRMPRGVKLLAVEIKEEKRGGMAEAEAQRREGQRLLEALPAGAEVIALDERGEMLDSPGFARLLGALRDRGRDAAFVIGGASGLAEAVKARADRRWSLSRLTLQHDLARLVLAEQIYRGFSILADHPYHK